MDNKTMDTVQAVLLEPLQALAGLLQNGEVDGAAAGRLLALVLAGARAEFEAA